MKTIFHKFHGAGNDFIIFDGRDQNPFSNAGNAQKTIAELCHRNFGIGADGLMILKNNQGFDFEMLYYNSDGAPATMCGNGARCLVAFALKAQVIGNECRFLAPDGEHHAMVTDLGNHDFYVDLQMKPVDQPVAKGNYWILDTGSPHLIEWVDNLDQLDVCHEGKMIRNSEPFVKNGINVNFVELTEDQELRIRTYERGVENETLACGTGITAAAIAARHVGKVQKNTIDIQALGGKLKVTFDMKNKKYENVHLMGPARHVFDGEIDISAFPDKK